MIKNSWFSDCIGARLQEIGSIRDTWNDLTSANLLLRAQNALCVKTDREIIEPVVSKLEGKDLSLFQTLLSCESKSEKAYPHSVRMQEPKKWEKRIWSLKSVGTRKSQIMDGVWWIMISNLRTDFMWQNRHPPPQHNHALMKIFVWQMLSIGLGLVARRR